MNSKIKYVFMLFLMLIVLTPFYTFAKSETVTNQEELLNALNDNDVDVITLGENINTTQKINITRPVTIDGKNHTIKYIGTFGDSDSPKNTVWGSIYILQVYKTTATIKNIKLTNGNAALLVNGSTVTLEGTIDVSGNGFGGIELAQGSGVTNNIKIILKDDINIINTTESESNPTIWVAGDSDDATIEMNGIAKTLTAGEEFSINEIEKILGLDIEENPGTFDNITLYSGMLLISLSLFIPTYLFYKKKEF